MKNYFTKFIALSLFAISSLMPTASSNADTIHVAVVIDSTAFKGMTNLQPVAAQVLGTVVQRIYNDDSVSIIRVCGSSSTVFTGLRPSGETLRDIWQRNFAKPCTATGNKNSPVTSGVQIATNILKNSATTNTALIALSDFVLENDPLGKTAQLEQLLVQLNAKKNFSNAWLVGAEPIDTRSNQKTGWLEQLRQRLVKLPASKFWVTPAMTDPNVVLEPLRQFQSKIGR